MSAQQSEKWHSWKDGDQIADNPFLQLPKFWHQVLEPFFEQGFYLTLVGGGPRDYLLTKNLPRDLDFELRHLKSYQDAEYLAQIETLKQTLKTRFPEVELESLSFGVFRLRQREWSLEFAPPRKETYAADKSSHGHSDFEVQIQTNLPYSQAFKRRDFTYNALGFEWNGRSVFLRDPLAGLPDLRDNKLRPCGPDFFLDPVRFLRLLRFQLRFNSKLDASLNTAIKQFDLRKLTVHYFIQEGLKSKPLSNDLLFFKTFYAQLAAHPIGVPVFIKELEFLGRVQAMTWEAPTSSQAEDVAFAIALSNSEADLSEAELKALGTYLKIKQGRIDLLIKLRQSLSKVEKISWESVRGLLAHWSQHSSTKQGPADLSAPEWELLSTLQGQLAKLASEQLQALTQHKLNGVWVSLLAPPMSGQVMFNGLMTKVAQPERRKLALVCHLLEQCQ